MNYTIKTSIPHGVTPIDAVGPFTPTDVTVTLKDFSTDTLPVVEVIDELKLVLDFGDGGANNLFRPEDVIAVSERDSCPSDSDDSSHA